jgi:hypothetical protein
MSSISIKQHEIITLIIIRKLFKDLSALELSENWFEVKETCSSLMISMLLFYFFI